MGTQARRADSLVDELRQGSGKGCAGGGKAQAGWARRARSGPCLGLGRQTMGMLGAWRTPGAVWLCGSGQGPAAEPVRCVQVRAPRSGTCDDVKLTLRHAPSAPAIELRFWARQSHLDHHTLLCWTWEGPPVPDMAVTWTGGWLSLGVCVCVCVRSCHMLRSSSSRCWTCETTCWELSRSWQQRPARACCPRRLT